MPMLYQSFRLIKYNINVRVLYLNIRALLSIQLALKRAKKAILLCKCLGGRKTLFTQHFCAVPYSTLGRHPSSLFVPEAISVSESQSDFFVALLTLLPHSLRTVPVSIITFSPYFPPIYPFSPHACRN